jgi:small-conductance mechanosensitive channel
VTDALERLFSVLGEFVPRLVGAVLVLLLALVVALFLQRLAARFLERIGLDELFERTGAATTLSHLGYDGGPSRLLGFVLFWGIIITGVAAALSVLGLSSLENTTNQIINLSGRALVALVILIAGVMSAGWLAELVAREAESAGLRGPNVFRRVVFIAVVTVAALLAAEQLGLETYVLILLAAVVLGTLGLVAAIALGQGLALLSGNIAAGRYVQDGTHIGDVISVDGIEGTVEELGYASITIRSEDGNLYRIPNRTLLEKVVRKRT